MSAGCASLAGRDMLRLFDLTRQEFFQILDVAIEQKEAWRRDPGAMMGKAPFIGKSVAVILEKPSLRTRVSFEVGISRLGAHPVVMSDANSAFSRDESIKDTVMTLERFVDCIVFRTFGQDRLETVARWAGIPVINALSDAFHPCQGLADFMTMAEKKGDLAALRIAYVGDGNNMAHTYLEGAALIGCELRIASPEGYQPKPEIVGQCQEMALETGARIVMAGSPAEAVRGADVLITDTWASMGVEDEHAARREAFRGYSISEESFALAAPGAIFLHCLPAHRGEEVSDAVMDGSMSAIYDEAENRLHAQMALMSAVMAPTRSSTSLSDGRRE
jgi:ornithine carbamoyltransferase